MIRRAITINSKLLRCSFGKLSSFQCILQNHSTLADVDNKIDRQKMLKILNLEVDVARQEGRRVPDPSFIREDQWDHLLTLKTKTARLKYYSYLWQIEKKRESQKLKKAHKSEEIEQRRKELNEMNEKNNHIIYGIAHTTFFLRIYDSTITNWYNNKLVNAMQFGPKIVLDCGYDANMSKREASNTAKQLMLLFSENRFNDEPFDLHFCNANLNEHTMKVLQKHIPTMLNPEFPLNIHKECFTQIFPKEKLVYLTPHCRTNLQSYNFDDIYVIGAIVDKTNKEPLSLAKAKKLNLRMARLPLDNYLSWSPGSGKSLTLDQMIKILLDIKKFGDWKYALRHVPQRKLISEEEEQLKKKLERVKVRASKFNFEVKKWGDPKIINPNEKNPFNKM